MKIGDIKQEWKPNKKQAAFLAIPFSIKEAYLGGGAGTGKSELLLLFGVLHGLIKNPRFKQVFMRRTRPDLKKEIVGRSREFFAPFGATYNGSDMIWTFPREDQYGARVMGNAGAQIFLAHCEEEKDVHNFDSMEISLFTPDELQNATEYIYIYITFERNRAPKDSGLPSITRAGGMPGGVGHAFTKKRFVDPYKPGGRIIVGKGGNKRVFIHATLYDNLDYIDPKYAQSLQGLPEAEKNAKLHGDYDAYLGQVFSEFRDRHYPTEPENALHVVPAFEIPSWWPKFYVGDWGFRALCYIGCFAISPNKRIYQYRELAWEKTKISIWAPILKQFIGKENPKFVKFCQSASQDRGMDNTIQQQIESEINRPIELSSNSSGSRVSGKMLVHEYLRYESLAIVPTAELPNYNDEKARWILRNKGLEDYKQYLKQFDPIEPETNLPKLQIFCCNPDLPTIEHEGHPYCCPLMINAIKACNYPKNNKDGKPSEDVAEFVGDDPYDTLRYALDSADAYFTESADEFAKIQQEAHIIERLKENQDFTAFYRNMNMLESQSTKLKPVSRFHSASSSNGIRRQR